MTIQDGPRLIGGSSADKVRLIAAIDHDSRGPQGALVTTLLRMQLLVGEMEQELHQLTLAGPGATGTPEEDGDSALKLLTQLVGNVQHDVSSVAALARQMTDLQQDLLDALRLDLDDSHARAATFEADDVLRVVYQNNRMLAANAGIVLRAGRSRLQVVLDRGWVERILNNLVANAIRHSYGTRIFIGARQRGGDVVFEVRDNGRGMKPEALARVFEPLSAPTSLPGLGYSTARSGLGLYIVRRFAELMRGSVSCESQPGAGTTFRIRLQGPVNVTGSLQAKRLDPKLRANVRNRFVAILDDDLELLQSAQGLFESMEVGVLADDEPMRWLNRMSEVGRMPDLFLIDYQLKGGQNASLWVDMVQKRWRDRRPRVVVVTGHYGEPELVRIAKTTPVLRKPLNLSRWDFLLAVLAGDADLPDSGFL
jgi:anti-sigma regulatory factor (Ser/Thr protein kinase)/CheY-like chemotaxis protein